MITEREQQGKWGDKISEQLSNDLQHELPGLKDVSATNIKRMRLFYQQWNECFSISQSVLGQLKEKGKKTATPATSLISPLPTDQLQKTGKKEIPIEQALN